MVKRIIFCVFLGTAFSLGNVFAQDLGDRVGINYVTYPAPKITDGQLPGIPGTSATYDPATSSYYYVEPTDVRQSQGPVTMFFTTGTTDAANGGAGYIRALLTFPAWINRDLLFIGVLHGNEDGYDAVQRAMDCLQDAMSRWNVDPKQVFIGGNGSNGARVATAVAHLLGSANVAGLALSSTAHFANKEAWDWPKRVVFFSGEDDADYDEIDQTYQYLKNQGKEASFFVGIGMGNTHPKGGNTTKMLNVLFDGSDGLNKKDTKQMLSPVPETNLETEPTLPKNEVQSLLNPWQTASKTKQDKGSVFGEITLPSVQVQYPSPLSFNDVPEFKGVLPANYDGQSTTYFLFIPATTPKPDRTLVVSLSTNDDGGYFFSEYQQTMRLKGAMFLGPNNISDAYGLAERTQRVMDSIYDVQQKYNIDKIILSAYCAPSGLATAVAVALPGQLHGLFLAGGAYPPGSTDIFSKLQVGKVLLWTGDKDYAHQEMIDAFDQINAAGLTVKLDDDPNRGHRTPTSGEIVSLYDWLVQ